MASHVLSGEIGGEGPMKQKQCEEKNSIKRDMSDEKREEPRDKEEGKECTHGDGAMEESIDSEISKKRKRSLEELLLEENGSLKVNALLKQCAWLEEHNDLLMQQKKAFQALNKEIREINALLKQHVNDTLTFMKQWAAREGIEVPVFSSIPEDTIKEGEKSHDSGEGRGGCSSKECRKGNSDEEGKEHRNKDETPARNIFRRDADVEREEKDSEEAKELSNDDGEMEEPIDDEVSQRIRLAKELFLGKEFSVLRENTFLTQYAMLKWENGKLDEQNQELWGVNEALKEEKALLKQQRNELMAFAKVIAEHSGLQFPGSEKERTISQHIFFIPSVFIHFGGASTS